MKPGDLVRMKRWHNKTTLVEALGIVLSTPWTWTATPEGPVRWVRILWPDYGRGVEKERDLEVISESG